ncbi:MAG: histidine kinase [Cyclobacteriaceae bacterium]
MKHFYAMTFPTARQIFLHECTLKEQISEISLIFGLGGLIQSLLVQDGFLTDSNYSGDLLVFAWSGSNWLFLWKGNEYLVRVVDYYYSWLDEPGRRFIAGTLVMLIYTVVAGIAIYGFFFGFILERDFLAELRSNFFDFIIWPIGITSVIMTVSHSRAFLQSWRQSAINAEKLKQENIASKYESLKNQVNPHFLFNSLNVLSGLVYEDQDKAVSFIRKMSDVYRYVLVHKEQELIPLAEELKFMDNYTYLQRIRFDDNLIVNIDKAENVKGWVPPLAIQLLVENAIKHNTVSKAHPLTVNVIISKDQIVVSNIIREKLSKDSTGIGLDNLKERYRYLSDHPVKIENDGHTFKVILPLLTIKEK